MYKMVSLWHLPLPINREMEVWEGIGSARGGDQPKIYSLELFQQRKLTLVKYSLELF